MFSSFTWYEQNAETFSEVRDGEEVPVAHSGGGDHQVPEGVREPEPALVHRVLVVVEWVSLVLQQVDEPSGPEEEPNYLSYELKLKE